MVLQRMDRFAERVETALARAETAMRRINRFFRRKWRPVSRWLQLGGLIVSFLVIAGPKMAVRRVALALGVAEEGTAAEQEADLHMARALLKIMARKVRQIKVA